MAVPRALITVDFDETITKSDTTPVIFEAATECIEDANKRASFQTNWTQFQEEYVSGWRETLENLIKTRENSPDYEFQQAFTSIAKFEKHSVELAFGKGYFKGVMRQTIVEKAKAIPIHQQSFHALQHEKKKGHDVAVVSLSWCRDLITTCVTQNSPSDNFQIYANELEYDSNSLSTGNITGHMYSGVDKLQRIQILKEEVKCEHSIHIGDSLHDLYPMLHADISLGILFNPSRTTQQFIHTFQLPVIPIQSVLQEKNMNWFRKVVVTNSWEEIQDLLNRIHQASQSS